MDEVGIGGVDAYEPVGFRGDGCQVRVYQLTGLRWESEEREPVLGLESYQLFGGRVEGSGHVGLYPPECS
jgi:hypothetical protein